jgi:hypothetical protein
MPKSITFTAPSNDTSTFCGETSRWTTLSGCPSESARLCAYPRPFAACATTNAASAGVSGLFSLAALRSTAESGFPCTSSITRKYSSPSWPTSMMRTTFG